MDHKTKLESGSGLDFEPPVPPNKMSGFRYHDFVAVIMK